MRSTVGVVILVVLLSGCAADDGPSSPSESSAAPSMTTTSDPAPPPIEVTDTLYFLRAPDMTLVTPTGSEPETAPYSFGSGFGGAVPRWDYRAQADAAPTSVDSTVWIRVVEPLFAPPSQAPCVWSLEVFAGDEYAFPIMCSGPPGPTITAGDYELKFSTDSANQTSVAAGTTWGFVLRRTAFSPTPNEAVLILVNSDDTPTHVKVAGAAEPKPAPP